MAIEIVMPGTASHIEMIIKEYRFSPDLWSKEVLGKFYDATFMSAVDDHRHDAVVTMRAFSGD